MIYAVRPKTDVRLTPNFAFLALVFMMVRPSFQIEKSTENNGVASPLIFEWELFWAPQYECSFIS